VILLLNLIIIITTIKMIVLLVSEGDPYRWSVVLVTALGSWGELVSCGHVQ
jgi:hypothetical protein